MSERVAMASDLLERVAKRLCKQGGATWPTKATPYAAAQRNAYEQLAWAAADEVMAWQSEQAVASAGPDPFFAHGKIIDLSNSAAETPEDVDRELRTALGMEIANG